MASVKTIKTDDVISSIICNPLEERIEQLEKYVRLLEESHFKSGYLISKFGR